MRRGTAKARKPIVVTLQELKAMGACKDGIDGFRETFGARVEVTRGNLLRMAEYAEWLLRNHPGMAPLVGRYDELVRPLLIQYWRTPGSFAAPTVKAAWRRYERDSTNVLADLLGLPRDKEKKGKTCRKRQARGQWS